MSTDPPLDYIAGYAPELQQQVRQLLAQDRLGDYLRGKYPGKPRVVNDGALREYVLGLKQRFLKQSEPVSKILFDNHMHIFDNALGLHTYASRVQGSRLKRKNEIRISALFKEAPEPLLRAIVVHELAHLREKDHGKAFYQLCEHMLPDYHQREFDARLFLLWLDRRPP